jgi:hypothetical protein
MKHIERDMVSQIAEICVKHQILTEDDLQFVTYASLLELVNRDHYTGRWRVFNRLYDSDRSQYPDLSLFNQYDRRIVIELKHEVERGTTLDQIEEDIVKVCGFLRDYNSLKFGVVLATLWDDEGAKVERLERFAAKTCGGDSRFRLIPIEISKMVGDAEHQTWQSRHTDYYGRFRGK